MTLREGQHQVMGVGGGRGVGWGRVGVNRLYLCLRVWCHLQSICRELDQTNDSPGSKVPICGLIVASSVIHLKMCFLKYFLNAALLVFPGRVIQDI